MTLLKNHIDFDKAAALANNGQQAFANNRMPNQKEAPDYGEIGPGVQISTLLKAADGEFDPKCPNWVSISWQVDITLDGEKRSREVIFYSKDRRLNIALSVLRNMIIEMVGLICDPPEKELGRSS